jgi:hypothetical protein
MLRYATGAYTEEQLERTLDHLLNVLRNTSSSNSDLRAAAFLAFGDVALAASDHSATDVTSSSRGFIKPNIARGSGIA